MLLCFMFPIPIAFCFPLHSARLEMQTHSSKLKQQSSSNEPSQHAQPMCATSTVRCCFALPISFFLVKLGCLWFVVCLFVVVAVKRKKANQTESMFHV